MQAPASAGQDKKVGYMTSTHVLMQEIPVVFWRTYGSRLHSLVKLQGTREDSQVRTVACLPILQGDQTWRLYLRAGWRDFTDANNLEVGQVLEFTLTADSFFLVRRANS